MSDILNKQIVLTLNRLHQAFELRSVRKAVEDITSLNPHTDQPPFMFVDITYDQREDGSYDTENPTHYRPVSVAEWINLPVRSCDLAINCGRRELRAPTVIIATNYDKVPEKSTKFSPEAIWARDNSTCQATGRKLTREEGDLGHNIARANGGRRSWDNIALLDKRLNRMQGIKTFAEMGWNIRPKAPKARRVMLTVKDAKHESHLLFLN